MKEHVSASPFRVRLKDLPTHRRIEVDGPFVARTLAGLPLRDALEAPADDPDAGAGVAEVDLYAEAEHGVGGNSVFLSGRFDGWLHVACSRCVGNARIDIHETLRVTYVPRAEAHEPDDDVVKPHSRRKDGNDQRHDKKAAASDDDEGVELAEDDLDVFPFDGETVDLEPLIREQFVLAVPFAPLCKEDCLGLCPMCGIDRNVESCSCEKPIDPRFAALEALKKGLKPTP